MDHAKREKGFYHAWQRLVKHDAIHKKTTTYFSTSAKSSNRSNRVRLSRIRGKEEYRQSYIESHLLSLPGWAGIMYHRSQTHSNDDYLLTDYVAIRLSIEMALLKTTIQHY